MTRLLCFAGVVLTAALAFAADEPSSRPVPVVQPSPVNTYFGPNLALARNTSLQSEQVQNELGLTPEQKEKFKEIAKKAADAAKSDPRMDWAKLPEMTLEERQKFHQEISDRYAKRAEETGKQMEQVLTPKQIEKLKDIEFRQRVMGIIHTHQVRTQLGLTNEQIQKVMTVHAEMRNKTAQVQRESEEKILGLLTPEQVKELRKISDNGGDRTRTIVEPKAVGPVPPATKSFFDSFSGKAIIDAACARLGLKSNVRIASAGHSVAGLHAKREERIDIQSPPASQSKQVLDEIRRELERRFELSGCTNRGRGTEEGGSAALHFDVISLDYEHGGTTGTVRVYSITADGKAWSVLILLDEYDPGKKRMGGLVNRNELSNKDQSGLERPINRAIVEPKPSPQSK